MVTELKKQVIDGIAPVTLADCVFLGDGTNKNIKDAINELSSMRGNGLTFQGELTTNLSPYGFNSPTFGEGIFNCDSSVHIDTLRDTTPPIKGKYVLINVNQGLGRNDWNFWRQTVISIEDPKIAYTRTYIRNSMPNNTKWLFTGIDSSLDRYSRLKMLTLGDSILAKWGGDPSDCTSTNPSLIPFQPNDMYNTGLQGIIYDRTHMDIWTLARGGARYARTPAFAIWDNYSFYQLASKLDFSQYDVLLVGYGTNDCGNSLPIGDINSTNVEETCGAINEGLTKIYESNPNILIFAVLPPVRMDLDGRAVRTFEENYARQKPYNDAIKAVYEKWNIPVFDSYNDSGVNKYNYAKYMNVDCIHYDDYSLWGGRVSEWLKRLL